MKSIIQKTSVTIIFAAIVLISYTTNAGAPVGHPESIETDLKKEIKKALKKEGYKSKNFMHNISAYLWDNRNMLKTTNVPKHKEVDLVICIMTRKGNTGFESYTSSEIYMDWCEDHLK
ncbi:MAG: hypothetical protein SCARUB_04641 [Candidatus Scalindua rubra]|uniref:Uncharacterized protein n=1 Tax=Candidatus Scalindua rubra TaxID=1872076 RepID=A0A1E3X3K2_9BACT|nr:MAG: hypothetical protein SCARUB_04641 [Candidatus Scalindua rubra]